MFYYNSGEQKLTGSTILTTISEVTQDVCKDDCRLLETKTEAVKGIDMFFCSLSLTSEDLIAPAVEVCKENLKEQTVLVGTVKRTLLPTLESAISSSFAPDSYVFMEVENRKEDSEYCTLCRLCSIMGIERKRNRCKRRFTLFPITNRTICLDFLQTQHMFLHATYFNSLYREYIRLIWI